MRTIWLSVSLNPVKLAPQVDWWWERRSNSVYQEVKVDGAVWFCCTIFVQVFDVQAARFKLDGSCVDDAMPLPSGRIGDLSIDQRVEKVRLGDDYRSLSSFMVFV